MSRRKLIAANWKMYKTIGEADDFVDALKHDARLGKLNCDLAIAPQFLALSAVADGLIDTTVAVGGQDVYVANEGAFTGEISPGMLKDAGAKFVIVGHSERRHVLGEGDDLVAEKLRAAHGAGLKVILCVGEKIEQREAGHEIEVVQKQLQSALAGFSASDIGGVVIAYEPVWAIGTGKTATPADAVAMHRAIRSWIAAHANDEVAATVRIQYGGSVKPANAAELLAEDEIDGALIGGASLDPGSFLDIALACPGGVTNS